MQLVRASLLHVTIVAHQPSYINPSKSGPVTSGIAVMPNGIARCDGNSSAHFAVTECRHNAAGVQVDPDLIELRGKGSGNQKMLQGTG